MKMRTTLALWLLAAVTTATAREIVLTPEQEAGWGIRTEAAVRVDAVPLSEVMAEVTLPPQSMRAMSLPFDAEVVQLYVAEYSEVSRGERLFRVGGSGWIEAQKSAVEDMIALDRQERETVRKRELCSAEIIAQKACVSAEAALQTARLKASASLALLKRFGADRAMLQRLRKRFEIEPYLDVRAPVGGVVSAMTLQPGETVRSADALLLIRQKGELWLESAMDADAAAKLQAGQPMALHVAGRTIKSRVLHLAPAVERASQTRRVRFSLPEGTPLLAGMRSGVTVMLPQPGVRLPKACLVKAEEGHVLFVKTPKGYREVPVTVAAETPEEYYIADGGTITSPVVVNAAAVLKAVTGEGGNE